MKKIKISNKNLYAIVDDEDYEYLSQFKWCIKGWGYAYSSKIGFMHDAISNPPHGMVVDHKNRNRLDNTRDNLRWATPSQNASNHDVPENLSGYRGVHPISGKYRVVIAGRHIGTYKTAEQAAKAYNKEAKKRWGEFAILNVIK